MPINTVSGASMYIHPDTGKTCCGHCDQPMAFELPIRNRISRSVEGPQVWCGNGECPAYNVVADVQVYTAGSSKHRTKPARG